MEDLEFVSKLIFDTYKIPIYYVDDKGDWLFEISHNSQPNPLYPSKKDLVGKLFFKDDPHPFPVFRTTVLLETFFSISLRSAEQFNGSLIVGPVLTSRLQEESIRGLINDLQLKVKQDEMIQYYQSLPVISNLNFINMSMLLYYMLYQEKLDLVDIQQNKVKLELEHPEVIVSERRQNSRTYRNPLVERKVLECIKEGKKDEIRKTLRALRETGERGVLSKTSHLRSKKNIGIGGVALVSRAAIEGGLYAEIAYNLSELFIQNIEEMNDANAISPFVENVCLEFAERVEKSKKHKYSKPINACLNYIFTHLYEDITIPLLGEIAGMNPSYLSVLFKKEVGMTLKEYIQSVKVDEAKSLMTYTSRSLTEISNLLNFHDQSHFTKIFKKFAGATPKQFVRGFVERN